MVGRAYTEFTLSFYDAEGRRVRRSFADAGEAKAEAQRVAGGVAAGRQESTRLTASEAETFLAAGKKVAPTGVSLLAALDEWLAARAALPPGSGLMDAVSYFASRYPANAPSRVVEEVVAEFLADRERAGVSRHYLRDIRCRLGRVSESFRNCPIASLTPALVGTYLASELADHTGSHRKNPGVSAVRKCPPRADTPLPGPETLAHFTHTVGIRVWVLVLNRGPAGPVLTRS